MEGTAAAASMEDQIVSERMRRKLNEVNIAAQSQLSFPIDNPSSSSTPESVNGVQLPLELISEILVRLPVKSLLKSKCVSKSWLSLISSPEFIRFHFSLSSSREGQYCNHQLLFVTASLHPVIKGCFLNSVLHEPTTQVFDVECPFLNPDDDSLWIVGTVNGLICLAAEENKLFIWNPVLKKSKRLPSPNISNVSSARDDSCVIDGFGYDESNDDYKVVRVQCVHHTGGADEAQVTVYSLLADSWRRIEDFKGWIDWDDTGKYANGKIYWTAWESSALSSCKNWKIVSLDMASEKYGELQRPGCVDADNWLFVVLSGRLFVLGDYYLTKKMDLWVMDKHGVEESWSKMVSIPYVDVNSRKPCPLYVLRKGEIVLANGSYLLVYHPKHKEFRNIVLDGCDSYVQSFEYVESLVWPNES